jgi:peptidoglycan/xylan/chitin deacetylase (PgdA/CDA1 family)
MHGFSRIWIGIVLASIIVSMFVVVPANAKGIDLRYYMPFSKKLVKRAMEKTPQFLKAGTFTASTINFRVPIFMYHSISNCDTASCVPEADFRAQMESLIAQGIQFITMTELLGLLDDNKPIPERAAILTFDDGYEDNFTVAYPYLMEKNVRATIFVVTNTVDTPEHVSWSQLRLMNRDGWDVMSHTQSHTRLTEMMATDVAKEISASKKIIESKLGNQVAIFCYPFGSYSTQIIEQVRANGYRLAVTVREGVATQGNSPFLLNRIRVDRTMDGKTLWKKAFETESK